MAKKNNSVNINVKYKVDKASLKEIQASLHSIQREATEQRAMHGLTDGLKNASAAAKELDGIIKRTWNGKLNQFDLSRFNREVNSSFGGVEQMMDALNQAGNIGQEASDRLSRSILGTNLRIRQSNKLLDEMAISMKRAFQYAVSSTAINTITRSVQEAYGYIKNLDHSLNEIRIVTNKSAEDMANFAVQANNAAKALGQGTTDYTKASLIYYQQGLSDTEVAARAETTLKAANVTGQSTEKVSEQLTSIWNGYKVSAEEAELYIDKVSAVAATTASDLAELSSGMSRVASAASTMGVDIDQLNAQLATIISVTRQAPESVGTAMRSILARISDIESGTDGETTLGHYTEAMKQYGINVLNSNNELRDMGEVIEEVGNKWSSMGREQQVALSQAMAGTRQYNSLLALFDNWDMYNEALITSQNAMGTLQNQQDIYMESVAAHLQQLRTQKEDLFDSLLDEESIMGLADAINGVLVILTDFVDTLGGGVNALLYFGTTFASVFNQQIGTALQKQLTNTRIMRENADEAKTKDRIIRRWYAEGRDPTEASAGIDKEYAYASKINNLRKVLSDQEYNSLTSQQHEIGIRADTITYLEKHKELAQQILNTEHETIGQWRDARKIQKETVKDTNDRLENLVKTYQEVYNPTIAGVSVQERLSNFADAIKDITENQRFEDDEAEALRGYLERIKNLNENATPDELHDLLQEDVDNIVEIQRRYLERERERLELTEQGLAGFDAEDSGLLDYIRNQQSSAESDLNEELQDMTRRAAFADVINQVTAVTMVMQPLIGMFQTLGDETLSAEEKMSRMFSTILFMLPSIINLFTTVNFSRLIHNLAIAFDVVGMSATAAMGKILGFSVTIAGVSVPLLGLVAAIGAVVFAITQLIKWYNKVEDAARDAEKAVYQSKETYQEIKQAYDELKESLASYESARAGLDELIKGTEEWKDAVEALNEQVLTLLTNYPELAPYISNNGGVLEISEEGRKEIAEQQDKETDEAYQRSLLDSINNSRRQDDLDRQTFKRTYDAITGVPGDVEKIIDAVDKNGEVILQSAESLAEAADMSVGQAEMVLENTDLMNDLLSLLNESEVRHQNDDILLQQVGNSLIDRTKFEDVSYGQQIGKVVGDIAKEALLGEGGTYQRYVENIGKLSNDKVKEELLDILGRGWENTEGWTFENEEGQTKTLTEQTARMRVAAEAARKEAEAKAEEVGEAIESVTNVIVAKEPHLKNAMANLAVGVQDLGDLNKREVKRISEANFNFLPENVLKTLGLSSSEDLSKVRDAAVENWFNAVKEITKGMPKSAKDAYKDVDRRDMFYNEQKFLADTFSLAAGVDKLTEAVDAYENGSLESFAVELEKLTSAAMDFASFNQKYADNMKLMNDIEPGSVISKEDYDTLDSRFKDYFVQMLDGTYKLTESAVNFRSIVENTLNEDAILNINKLKEQNEGIGKISGYDFEGLTSSAASIDKKGKLSFDATTVQQQIDVVRTLGDSLEDVTRWQEQLNEGNFTSAQELHDLADAVEGCREAYDNMATTQEANNQGIDQYAMGIAFAARNLSELKELLKDGTIGFQEYTKAALALDAEQDLQGLDIEELETFADYLKENAENLEGFNANMTDKEALVAAKNIMKMNDAIDTLADSFKNWKDILVDSTRPAEEYAEAFGGIKAAVADLLDVSDDYVSLEFIKENLDLIGQAAKGSETAIDTLKSNLGDQIVANIIVDNAEFITSADEVQSKYDWLKNNIPDLSIATELETSSYIDALNEFVRITGATVDQVNALCDTLGFEAAYETKNEPTSYTIPTWTSEMTATETDPTTGMPTKWEMTTEPGPSVTLEGDYSAFAMATATNGDTPAPKITGLTQKPSGIHNNFSSANKGGPAPGKKKSGGGGKSNKEQKPDKMDVLKDQTDRYHDINLELERLKRNLDSLDKAQEKAYGRNLLAVLNQQLKVLEKQAKAYKEKLKLAKEEREELQASLKAQGVTFDKDGYISNYNEMIEAKSDAVNALINQYNAMTKEEQQDFKESVETAKKEYEDFKKKMEDYDKLVSSTIPDIKESIQEAKDKMTDLRIEKFTTKIEMKLELGEAQREYNEFKRKVIDGLKDTDILENMQSKISEYLSYFKLDDMNKGTIKILTDRIKEIRRQINQIDKKGTSSIYGDNKNQAMEDLEKYYKELMKQLESTTDLVNEIKDSYLTLIEEAIDAFDEHVKQYESIRDIITHDMDLIELLYGEDSYAEMHNYYEELRHNNNNQIEFMRRRTEEAKRRMEIETDPEARKKWEQEWKESLTSLNQAINQAVEDLNEEYANSINLIFQKIEDKLTSGKGFDYLQTEWDLVNKQAEQYLNTVDSLFAVQDLTSKYQEALNDNDSLYAQQKIKDVMEDQLKMLREKDKLTQYDVDRANQIYELTLKEIALRDAEMNKTKMRLRRDSQGNYTYQFVADEDEIENAKKEVLEAQKNLVDLDTDSLKQSNDKVLEYTKKFYEEYAKIVEENTDEEEREQKLALLREKYDNLVNNEIKEREIIKRNLQEDTFKYLELQYQINPKLFEEMTGKNIDSFRKMTDEEKELMMEKLVPNFKSSIDEMVEVIQKEGGFTASFKDAFSQIEDVTDQYRQHLKELEDISKQTFSTLRTEYDQTIQDVERLIHANGDLIGKYQQEIDESKKLIESLDAIAASYEKIWTAAEKAITSINKFIESQKMILPKQNVVELNSNTNTSSGRSQSTTVSLTVDGKIPKVKKTGKKQEALNAAEELVDMLELRKFDTGGYTGSWAGGNGKIAILHEKELVLNAKDTSNILSAVELVRNIPSILNSLNNSMTNRIISLSSSFKVPDIQTVVNTNSEPVEQKVHIEASFPNVENSNEIKDALNNLVNIAEMRAYRNNR